MPGAGLPGIPRQRLPREPYPRPGVVEAEAKFIQAQVLIPLFSCKGVVVVRVREGAVMLLVRGNWKIRGTHGTGDMTVLTTSK